MGIAVWQCPLSAPVGSVGRCMQVLVSGIVFFHILRQELFEKAVVVLFHVVVGLFVIFFVPAPEFYAFIYFIIAAPQGEAGMVSQSFNVVFRFLSHVFQETVIGRVGRACKHEILPYQDAVFIGFFIKFRFFIISASPDAYHVHVGGGDVFKQFVIVFPCKVGGDYVVGDIVGSFCKQGDAVDFEIETLAHAVIFAHQFHRAEAYFQPAFVQRGMSVFRCYGQRGVIEHRFSPAGRHPQLRIVYRAGHVYGVHAFGKAVCLFFCQDMDAVQREVYGYSDVSSLHGTDCYLIVYVSLASVHFLIHEPVVYLQAVIKSQFHGAPYPAADESHAPVPTVLVWRFACEYAQVLVAPVVVGRVVETVGVPLCQSFSYRGVKHYGYPVFSCFQYGFHVCRVGYEHVVGSEDVRAVQIDIGIGVESEKLQRGGIVRQLVFADFKFSLILPVFLFQTPQRFFVFAPERVFHQSVVEQVGVDCARHFCRI